MEVLGSHVDVTTNSSFHCESLTPTGNSKTVRSLLKKLNGNEHSLVIFSHACTGFDVLYTVLRRSNFILK